MTYYINPEECILCGACEAACPEGAISEIDGAYVVNESMCVDHGACADVCPTGAVGPKA